MKRRVAAIFLVVLAAAIGFLAWTSPWKSSLPPFHRATMGFIGPKEQAEVELSLGQQEEFHKLFSGVSRDRLPKKWQVFGVVRLFDEAGREVSTVEVFSNSEGAGPFRIGEDYFIGYDQKAFREMLEWDNESSLPK